MAGGIWISSPEAIQRETGEPLRERIHAVTQTIDEPPGFPPLPEVDDAPRREFLVAAAESVLDNPLWRQIPAVRNGEAYRVDVAQWMNFGGLRSAHLVLDDVEEHLTREG
jgi:hypothetical protein